MKYCMFLELPMADLFELLPQDVQFEITELDTLYPSSVAPGTKEISTSRLLYCVVDTEVADITTLLNSLIILYELDWTILALRSLRDIDEILVEEEIVGHEPVYYVPFDTTNILPYFNSRYDDLEVELTKDKSWGVKYQGITLW